MKDESKVYDIVCVNGSYINKSDAKIGIEDRGLIFGDSVYEVMLACHRGVLYFDLYMQRLYHSLFSIGIDLGKNGINPEYLYSVILKLIELNNTDNMVSVYLQITRGEAVREHAYPVDCPINFFVMLYPYSLPELHNNTKSCMSHLDIRWGRCDIKTTSLMANVMLKQKALDAGFDEVILFDDDGFMTECSKYNSFIVTKENVILTCNECNKIISGITRGVLINLAKSYGYKVIEGKYTIDDVLNASEVFLTTTREFVVPVIRVDNHVISKGVIGAVSEQLYNGMYSNAHNLLFHNEKVLESEDVQ